MDPDILWKKGNLNNPKSDGVQANLFPNWPEDAHWLMKFPEESDKGNILLIVVNSRKLNKRVLVLSLELKN